MIPGKIYIDNDYGIIKIRKVYTNGAIAIADELNEDLTHKLESTGKLNGPGNWVSRAIPKKRGEMLKPFGVESVEEIFAEQQELF